MSRLVIFLAGLLLLSSARAEVVVLVHGYLGDSNSWREKGVAAALSAEGWSDGGALTAGTRAFSGDGPPRGPKGSFYTVNLPSTAPLMYQSDLLWTLMHKIFDHHPDEEVVLVGHSAGGVVARLALVRFGAGQISTLITLASPHLGTPRALQGLDVIQDHGPFELIKDLVGGKDYRRLKGSGPALWDLSPPRPGNLLYWLNAQVHPDIRYVSVLRLPDRDGGDDLVPVFSQDINQVTTLRGKSEIVQTFGDHFLHRSDGTLIGRLAQSPPHG